MTVETVCLKIIAYGLVLSPDKNITVGGIYRLG